MLPSPCALVRDRINAAAGVKKKQLASLLAAREGVVSLCVLFSGLTGPSCPITRFPIILFFLRVLRGVRKASTFHLSLLSFKLLVMQQLRPYQLIRWCQIRSAHMLTDGCWRRVSRNGWKLVQGVRIKLIRVF